MSTVDPLSAVKTLASAWKLSFERGASRYMVTRKLSVADVRSAIATALTCEPSEGWWQVSGGVTLEGEPLEVVVCSDFGVVDVQEILGGEGQPEVPEGEGAEDEERLEVAGITFVVGGLKSEERSESGLFFTEETVTRLYLLVANELARLGLCTAETFRFVRHALGLSTAALAELFERTPAQVASWEQGGAVDRAVWAALTAMVAERIGEVGDTIERLKALADPQRPERVELSA